jgi:hypothetical protein
MDRSKSGWKNMIGSMEVFQCGTLGLKIDNDMKNMPISTTFCFVKLIDLFILASSDNGHERRFALKALYRNIRKYY